MKLTIKHLVLILFIACLAAIMIMRLNQRPPENTVSTIVELKETLLEQTRAASRGVLSADPLLIPNGSGYLIINPKRLETQQKLKGIIEFLGE